MQRGDAVTEDPTLQERRRRTHSVDTSLQAASRSRLYTGSQELPPISSPPDTPVTAGTPTKRLKVPLTPPPLPTITHILLPTFIL